MVGQPTGGVRSGLWPALVYATGAGHWPVYSCTLWWWWCSSPLLVQASVRWDLLVVTAGLEEEEEEASGRPAGKGGGAQLLPNSTNLICEYPPTHPSPPITCHDIRSNLVTCFFPILIIPSVR